MVDDEERSVNDATHTSRLLLSVKFQLEKTNGSTHITLLRLNLMFLLASCVLDTLSLLLFIGSISGGKCVVFEDRNHSGPFYSESLLRRECGGSSKILSIHSQLSPPLIICNRSNSTDQHTATTTSTIMFGGGIPFEQFAGGFPGASGSGRMQTDDVDTSKLYETLEVEKTATQKEIRKAYMKLSRTHHPDKGGDEHKFKEISAAYEILVSDMILQHSTAYHNVDVLASNRIPDSSNPIISTIITERRK